MFLYCRRICCKTVCDKSNKKVSKKYRCQLHPRGLGLHHVTEIPSKITAVDYAMVHSGGPREGRPPLSLENFFKYVQNWVKQNCSASRGSASRPLIIHTSPCSKSRHSCGTIRHLFSHTPGGVY